MSSLIILLVHILDIYLWTIIIAVMCSWLIAFEVLNMKNKWVYKIVYFLNEVTRPPIMYLRRYVQPIGGIDITPMILIFGIMLLRNLLLSFLFV